MPRRRQQELDPPATRGVAVASVLVLVATVVAFATYFLDLPVLVGVSAVAIGTLTMLAVGVIVFRAGRRTGHGFWRCLWAAIKLPFEFLTNLPW